MSELLHPRIKILGNRHYRVNPMKSQTNFNHEEAYHEDAMEYEEPSDLKSDWIVKPIRAVNEKFTCTIHVPTIFFGFIIGRGGQTRSNLEKTTRCKINVPRNNPEIVIESTQERCIEECIRLIQMKVMECRLKSKPSHYLELHLTSPETVANLTRFKEELYAKYGEEKLESFRIYKSMFQLVEKFHITLSVFNVGDDFEYNLVERDLEEFLKTPEASEVFREGPFHFSVRGLEIMNDETSSTNVLYAKVIDNSERVQRLADAVALFLHEKNWTDSSRGGRMTVKLHATLINSSKRTEEQMEKHKDQRHFDVTEIMRDFGHYEFVNDCIVDRVRIAQIHSVGSEGNVYNAYIQINSEGKTTLLKNYD